ncbi:hypothetical protein AVEN_140115-1 [Araneus ventricosus]|uniref:Uncharacterized protein n=1 Tax=Araneus ventricosus TaxID=182803 RepID=A0A4Y2LR98_ARAVE|nr:hypothetical protein AVEN_140115-1 [Araneus ventricosus]
MYTRVLSEKSTFSEERRAYKYIWFTRKLIINKTHPIADKGNLNLSGRLMLRLGEMASTVCCTSVDPTMEAHTSLSKLTLCCCSLPLSAGNGKDTHINTLTNSALAEQLHLLNILHERIKLCRLMER